VDLLVTILVPLASAANRTRRCETVVRLSFPASPLRYYYLAQGRDNFRSICRKKYLRAYAYREGLPFIARGDAAIYSRCEARSSEILAATSTI